MADELRERFRRLEEIFAAVRDCSAVEREDVLARACGDDTNLRRQVEQMLDAAEHAGPFLEPPANESLSVSDADESSVNMPKSIGPYGIQGVIATGGMGTIYRAVQDNPRRTVAVKVMRRGITSRSALRRFEYESQVLARLRHPAIAQVFQAGTHDDAGEAVPYFAMEYVPNAKAITEDANQKQLGTRQRLELFLQVCDAIHHGHQKGIIHRDLKPANILVDPTSQREFADRAILGGVRPPRTPLRVCTSPNPPRTMQPTHRTAVQLRASLDFTARRLTYLAKYRSVGHLCVFTCLILGVGYREEEMP